MQADHPLVTATQIADHEAFHAKANRNGAEMIDRLAERIASMDKDAFDRVVDKYAKALEAIYDTSDYDAFMRIVTEEMLADAYSGINAFGVHAEQFGDTVNQWMDEHFIGKKSETEMEQLRGPPEGQRFSADEKSVEALVEKVKTGVYKANEHIDFGFVDQKTIDAIRRIYDFDVTGFKVRLEARQIAHILKDHGENGKTDHSMSDSSNIARMRWAMAEADSIEDAGTTDAYVEFRDGKNRPAKTIIYEKNLGEKSYYVVEAVPNTSKKTLYIVTAFVGPGQYKSNPQQSANAQGPGTTAKTAAVEDSNSIVAEKAKTVKQNFSVDDAEYLRLAENPAQNYDRHNEMIRQAAEDAGYNRLFYHGAKNGGGFTVFRDWQYFTENRNYAARYAQRDADATSRRKTGRTSLTDWWSLAR